MSVLIDSHTAHAIYHTVDLMISAYIPAGGLVKTQVEWGVGVVVRNGVSEIMQPHVQAAALRIIREIREGGHRHEA